MTPQAPPAQVILEGMAGAPALRLQQTLRYLPGRRWVCRGRLDGAGVIAKLYPEARRRDWRRETSGLRALGDAGPTLRYSGGAVCADTDARYLIAVTGEIAAALPLGTLQQREGCVAPALARQLLERVAALHQRGVRLLDPHLDNFVLDQQEVVRCVDGGAVRGTKAPITARAARADLALVLAQFSYGAATSVDRLAAYYADARGWPVPELERAVRRWRQVRWRRYRRKIFRDCTEFRTLRTAGYRVVVRRDCVDSQFLELLAGIDQRLSGADARPLKNGNSATVVRLETGAGSVVIKRYNIKGWRHRLRRLGRRSRAVAAWRGAHFLRLHGLPTPEPVALVEPVRRRLPGRSYLLSRHVEARSATEVFAALPWTAATTRAARQVCALFGAMASLGFSHGDLKASNLLVAGERIALIDLEGLAWHRSQRTLRRAMARDRRRFLANWQDDVAARFDALLSETAGDLPPGGNP